MSDGLPRMRGIEGHALRGLTGVFFRHVANPNIKVAEQLQVVPPQPKAKTRCEKLQAAQPKTGEHPCARAVTSLSSKRLQETTRICVQRNSDP